MIIVLDTCAIIWNEIERNKLTFDAKAAIEEANKDGSLIFCDISFWEIALLRQKGRLHLSVDYNYFIQIAIETYRYSIQSITPEIAECAATLPPEINADPADRIIAATSIILKAPLITSDKNLRKSKLIKTIW